MAMTTLAFIFFAVMTFCVVMLLTRPSATDRTIQSRLGRLQAPGNRIGSLGEQNAEFLKRTNLSKIPWLDKLLQSSKAAQGLSVLLAQAHSSWLVSNVLLASAILAAMGFSIVYYWLSSSIPALIVRPPFLSWFSV